MHPKNDVQDALVVPAVLDQGTPELDSRAFRTCLGQFATGVTVMATQVDGRLVGTTVGSFSSLSLNPPLVLWSIARSSRSAAMFERATHFTVNVLAEDQIDLSQNFASSSDDKFANIQSNKANNGCPVFPGIVALFECEREATLEGGDHWIIVGRVRRFVRYAGKPLLFAQSRYAVPQTHPQLQSSSETRLTEQPKSKAMAGLSFLLVTATRLRLGGFEKYRRAEGVNYLQSRVLFGLDECPGQNAADLAQKIFAAPDDCADAVAELSERGLITQEKGKASLTDAGRAKCSALQISYDRYEAECLCGFSEDQIRSVREFLEAFIRKFEDPKSVL